MSTSPVSGIYRYLPLCYLPLVVLLYRGTYTNLLKWWNLEDYTYCYFILPIVLYLIWERRSSLRSVASQPNLGGVLVLGFGLVLFWLGELGGEYYSLYLSSWLVLMGLLLLHLGWNKIRIILFPLCFIPAMFPFPNIINSNLSLKLKLISSAIGVKLLQLSGMSAYREGNIIDLDFTRLQVVDACSGLRYLLPLIILAILVASMSKLNWWQRITLVISSIPLTVIVNSIRIASVGWLYPFFGPKVAEGFFHDFSGWLIFMISLAILLAELWLMLRIVPPSRSETVTPDVPASPPVSRRAGSPLAGAVTALLLLGSSVLALALVDFRENIPMSRSFAEFPLTIDGWQGTRGALDQKYLDALKLTDYLLADYRNGSGRPAITLYVAYYSSQRKGESSHSPETCLPGSGWVTSQTGQKLLPLGSRGGNEEVIRSVMNKTGETMLVYYWFPQRGRILTNLYQLKWYAFWDALTRQRTDGALVRLTTVLAPYEQPSDADTRMQRFVTVMWPRLNEYLPPAER